jgi:trk system potassium uptake protein TrkH
MNLRLVAKQLSLLLIVLSACMVACAALAAALVRSVDRIAMEALLGSAVAGIVAGSAGWLLTRTCRPYVGRREALLLVALTWVAGAALAGAPYFAWCHLARPHPDHVFLDFIDCSFEAMSGLTTTGASVLGDPANPVEKLPAPLLLWRATTHWLGGLGIVVLFVAVLPSLGAGGRRLFRFEAPGPTKEGLRPHIRETARVLFLIYIGLSILETVLLYAFTPMSFFDSICQAMSTLSTGGLSTKDASIRAWNSVAADLIIAFFMIVAGMNFALLYRLARLDFRALGRDVELRAYLTLKVAGILLVWWNVTGGRTVFVDGTSIEHTPAGAALRHAIFVTATMQTGTGFCTADYEQWPRLSVAAIFGVLFIGGCAGSTAGGVKVIRAWVALKVILAELEKAFRPNVVRALKVGGSALEPDMKLGVVTFVLGFILTFAAGAFAIALIEPDPRCDFVTAASASISTLANVGPGLGAAGAAKNYGWFSDGAKLVMIALMALGRLEFFALLVLFTPRFWRGD